MAKISKERIQNRLNKELNAKLSSASLDDVIFGGLKSKKGVKSSSLIEVEYVNSYGNKTDEALYVFKTKDNLIFSPGDDAFDPILAVIPGEYDNFNFDNLIEPAKLLLNNYIDNIEYYQENNSDIIYGDGNTDTTLKEDWHDIDAFITYKWGQGTGEYNTPVGSKIITQDAYKKESYNASIILTEVSSGCDIRCLAGCPGTALSMIIAYWGQVGVSTNKTGHIEKTKYRIGCPQLPEYESTRSGWMKYNYDPSKLQSYKWVLTVDSLPAITEFDYDKFIDKAGPYYKTPSSTSPTGVTYNKDKFAAVSTLFNYVCRAIRSSFSPYATNALINSPSSTKSMFYYAKQYLNINNGLKTQQKYTFSANPETVLLNSSYFDYGQTMILGTHYQKTKEHYDAMQLMIYRDIRKGIPILFSAQSTTNSSGKDSEHSFICDGYQKNNDLFHFNFGWRGKDDGWFSLNYNATNHIHPAQENYHYIYRQYPINRIYPNEFLNDYIDISKEKVKFTKDGGTYTISVFSKEWNASTKNLTETSNSTWEIQGFTGTSYKPVSWVTITKDSVRQKWFHINVDPNTTSTKRTCDIVVYKTLNSNIYETLTIEEEAGEEEIVYTLSVSPTSYTFENTGGNKTFTVTSNTTWTVSYSCSWLSHTTTSTSINFTASANQDTTQKSCVVTVKTSDNSVTKTITINIKAYVEPTYTLDLALYLVTFSFVGGSKSVAVTSNTTWDINSISSNWLTVQKSGDNIILTAVENTETTQKSVNITVHTTNNSVTKTLTCILQAMTTEDVTNYLQLSTNNIIFDENYKTAKVNVKSSTTWYIQTYTADWFTMTQSNNQLTITCKNNISDNKNKTITFKSTDDTITETLTLSYVYEEHIIDNIGEIDDDNNIVTNKNGQNITLSIYGLYGTAHITDLSKIQLFYNSGSGYTDITSGISQEDDNLIYHLTLPSNTTITDKLYKLYGKYNHSSSITVNSTELSFIQHKQEFSVHITTPKEIYLYNDTDTLDLTYWTEISNGEHIYNTTDVVFTIIANEDGSDAIQYTVNTPETINNTTKTIYRSLRLNNNTGTNERKLTIQVSYKNIESETLVITQLSQSQQLLKAFDFFTLEYNVYNDNQTYTSIRDYNITSQLNSVNAYGGERLQTIAKLSTNNDIAINKTVSNIVTDLTSLKVGYNQDITADNNAYSSYIRYSGNNYEGIETESMLINLKNIKTNINSDIREIYLDFYGNWSNTRSTGKINTKFKTYKNSPSSVSLNNYVYTVSNTLVDTVENINYVYDYTTYTSSINYYTHVLRLTYNLDTNCGYITHKHIPGNFAKNIFVFAPGDNQTYITNFINNAYVTNITIGLNAGTIKIYLQNSIYQVFSSNALSAYQALTNTITIKDKGGISSATITTSGSNKYLQFTGPSTAGTYNIVLTLQNLNDVTFKVNVLTQTINV